MTSQGPPDVALVAPTSTPFHVPDKGQCVDIAATLIAIDRIQTAIGSFSKDPSSIRDVSHGGENLHLDFAGIARVLSSAQEELYASLVALQLSEVGRIESLMKEVTRPDVSRRVPLQTQILQIQSIIDRLIQWKGELGAIIQSPDPLSVPCSDEGQGDKASQSPQHHTAVGLRSRAGELALQCQGLLEEHEEMCLSLQEQLQSWKTKFSSNLGECEAWLREVYGLLCTEPNRFLLARLGEEENLTGEEEDLAGEEETIEGKDGGEQRKERKGVVRRKEDLAGEEEDLAGEEENLAGEEEDLAGEEEYLAGEEETVKEEERNGGEEVVWEEGEEQVRGKEEEFSRDKRSVWDLDVLPLMHLEEWEEVDEDVTYAVHDIGSELKKRYLELGERQHRVRSAEASLTLVVDSLPREEAKELGTRLLGVMKLLGPLDGRLSHRIAQLGFEKVQRALLEELIEAENELESHLVTFIDESPQQAYTDFKEFFTSPDHFQSQLEGQLKEMEAIVEQLLSFGKEDSSLLGHTLQQLKNTCHVTCSRVSKQKAFLEGWVEFERCYSCLGEWLTQAEEKIMHEAYGSTLDEVASFRAALELLSCEMDGKRGEEKETLHHSYETLKPHLSKANSHKVEQDMLQLEVKWEKLRDALRRKISELCPLRDKVEHFWSVLGEVKGWLGEMERRYEACGPIGAHLERLLEQGPILQAIDEECIAHKEDPDRVCAKAADIAAVWGGRREELVPKAEQLRKQFVDFLERLLEQRERCEEAVAAMQQFQMEYDTFDKWLCEVQDKQRQWTEKKAPIGVIGGELEEYYDFMREVEGHTKQYSALRSHSERLASQYKPSDHLEGMMESVGTKWEGFVATLDAHCGEKHTLKGRWEEYEREVKDLLGWMTQEANRFSREVTEKGEKGIEDHVESCQLFTDTLGAKVGCRDRVFSLGVELTSHDGMKKNGTSDVSSRIHDVQVHWECVCKLLDETILRLEATRAQMCYIQQVTDKEFDWLERCEEQLSGLKASRGRREVIEEEISLLEGVAGEVVGHAHYKRFICEETEGFMLEHLRGRDREPTACKVRDFAHRYQSLSSKLETCIGNLRESIPLWAHFSGLHGSLVQELSSARRKLGSANPSTFVATQKSLEVARALSGGLGTMQHTLSTLDHVSDDLRPLCVQDDQNYIQQLVGVVSDDLDDLTNLITESVERLEHRMKSWEQVLPVVDVMAVQEFLEQAQNVMMSSVGDETSEDMEEKVKMLESLLQSQDTNAQKVSSIDQSSKSEAVKKSLEKNPDISQEKDRLLNDWSTVFYSLRQKFEETRRCISVTKELECLLMQCHKAMEEYQTFLSLPLPSLVTQQQETLLKQSSLHSSCEKAIAMVTSVLKRSLADGIAVPTHLQTKTQLFVEQFESLTSQASQRSRVVSHALERWQSFTASMEKSTSQLSDAQSELASLVQVEEFLMELTSLESRLSILEENLQTNLGELDGLRKDLPSHLFGDECHVIAKMADLSQLEQQWAQVKDCVHRLQMDLIPWRKLVDVQEELQNRFDQLKATAEEQFGLARRSEEEHEATNFVPKGLLAQAEQYILQVDGFHQSYVSMLGAEVCSRHPPAQRFSEVCVALENDWRSLLERLKGSVEEMAAEEEQRKLSKYRETLMKELQSSHESTLHQSNLELARVRQEMIDLRKLFANNRENFDAVLAKERLRLTEQRQKYLNQLEQKQQSFPAQSQDELQIAELKTKIESVDGQLQTLNRQQRAVIDAQDLIDIQDQFASSEGDPSSERGLVLRHRYSRGLEATPLPSDFLSVIATWAPGKWTPIALSLGLTSDQVHCIQLCATPPPDVASCLIQVFEAWQGLGTRNHTWGAVVDAMDTAGCGQVAQELRAKLMESHDALDGPPPLSLTPPTQTQRATPQLETIATPHLLLPHDINVLHTILAPMRAHWRAIGHHLGFTDKDLDSLSLPNHSSHIRQLLERWMTRGAPCTEDLIGALKGAGLAHVAQQVEEDGFLMSPWRVKYETAV